MASSDPASATKKAGDKCGSKSKHDGGLRLCANNCGNEGTSRCGGCGVVYYCCKNMSVENGKKVNVCQREHWKYGGHKKACKAYVIASTKQAALQRLSLAAVDTDKCLICLEPPSNPMALPCGHSFCTGCVEELRAKGVSDTCPLCRAPLPPGPEKLYDLATRICSRIHGAVVDDEGKMWSALSAEQQNEMNDAIVMLQEATDQKHGRAADVLGATYYYGRGCARDLSKAYTCYKVAAECGNVSCMLQIGLMLCEGRGVAKDERQGVKWYKRAEVRSQDLLNGTDGGAADHTPLGWGDIHCDGIRANYTQCLLMLSSMYFNGQGGLKPSVRLSIVYIERALNHCPIYDPELRQVLESKVAFLRNYRAEKTGGLMDKPVVVAHTTGSEQSLEGKRGVCVDWHGANEISKVRCSVQLDTGELIEIGPLKLYVADSPSHREYLDRHGPGKGKGKGGGKSGGKKGRKKR